MPKKLPRLAEEGRIRGEEEYLEWAARVSMDTEDIREGVTEERWRAHVLEKYRFSMDPDLAANQLKGLYTKGILGIWEKLPEAGVTPFMSYPRGIAHIGFYGHEEKHFISFKTVAAKMGWFIR